MTTNSIDATGVRSTRSSSVADFNEARHGAARSENKFYGRSTARSHETNVTSDKRKHAQNSFRHSESESKQIKNAINFSVWRKFIQFQKANENFGGVGDFDYGRQAGSLCKNPGCQNICGPLHFYPIDLQQKIKNQEFNLPKRCVDCIAASRLPTPQQVANAVRHAPTAHSDATWTARSSNAHPGGPSEGILCKLDFFGGASFAIIMCAFAHEVVACNACTAGLTAHTQRIARCRAARERHTFAYLLFPFVPRNYG